MRVHLFIRFYNSVYSGRSVVGLNPGIAERACVIDNDLLTTVQAIGEHPIPIGALVLLPSLYLLNDSDPAGSDGAQRHDPVHRFAYWRPVAPPSYAVIASRKTINTLGLPVLFYTVCLML